MKVEIFVWVPNTWSGARTQAVWLVSHIASSVARCAVATGKNRKAWGAEGAQWVRVPPPTHAGS